VFKILCPFVPRDLTQLQGEWQRAIGSEGDQPGEFSDPRGLALTPNEEFLLVADGGNRRVTVLQALDGAWVRQLTGPPGTLEGPNEVAVVPSTGEVLVSDRDRQCVFRFRSIDDDTVVGTLGTGQGSGPTEFDGPCGLAVLDSPLCPVVCFLCVLSSVLCGDPYIYRGLTRDGLGRRKPP
jgi:hypothetical protein